MGTAIAVTVPLDQETKTRLANMAENTRRSEEDLASEALRHFLDIQESQYKAIDVAMQESLAGTATHASHEDVMAWVSSWGTDRKLDPPQCS